MRPRDLCVALTLLASVAANAADSAFHWPGHTIPGAKLEERGALSIVDDEAATSVRQIADEDGKQTEQRVALEQRVSRRAIAQRGMVVARTPRLKWSDVEPGLYEITARIAFEGDIGLIGTPIVLQVEAEGRAPYGQFWAPCDFTETGVYTELKLRYEVDPTGAKRLAANRPYHAIRCGGWVQEVYPDIAPLTPAAQPPKQEAFTIALLLPQTKYESINGRPPNSLRWLRLDYLAMKKIDPAPAIALRAIKPAKVWLRPGETNTFAIYLENFTTERQQRDLVVAIEHGLAQRQELHRQTVELAAGAATTVTIDWPTDDAIPLWGYEVNAEIRLGDLVEQRVRDVFSLHPRIYDVHVMGSNSRQADPFRANESYQNLVEVFGATSGDCAGIMPRGETWMSGMMSGGLPQTFPIVRHAIARNRAQGIATHMYLFAGGTGTQLMDLYVQHPEWLASRPVATDVIYTMRQEREQAIAANDFAQRFIDPPSVNVPHIEHHLNHWFPELKAKLEREAVEFVQLTGYEGIRFDVGIFSPKTTRTVLGTDLPYDMKDAQTHAARNFTDFRDALLAVSPHVEFGANMDSWAYLEQVGNRNVTPKPPEEYPEFLAFARAHGMFMDEGTMSAPFYDHYMNRWEDALWGMAQKRDMAGRYGGIYQLFSPHRDGNGHFAHDDIYFAVCIVASGSHYVGNFAAPPYTRDSIGYFLTRYGEFFWSTGRRLLPDARDLIYVDAPADVWYADTAAYENVGTKRRYIVPLINPPVAERLRRNKTNELPPPIDEPFDIEIAIPEGFTQAEATMLTWEPTVSHEKLPCKIEGNTATVRFPALQLFRTLIVEFAP